MKNCERLANLGLAGLSLCGLIILVRDCGRL